MSPRSTSPVPSSPTQIEASPDPSSTHASNSPLRTLVDREHFNVHDPSHSLDHRLNVGSPKDADEAVSNPLFPPLPVHYSFATIQLYRFLSMILSVVFLSIVMLGAMVKTIPSIWWVTWSRLRFKDPNRLRPFHQQEKERRHIDKGKLKCDIGYYAQRVNLESDETEIVTEDGFILTIQHIVDRSTGSTDWKRIA
jgi:Partial alpha/beta-hydrolase lipase region